jgi:bifunctional DNA-binding transcriptional regulator/antitoxin component of YhaV-PrlF toxin-antitoxin module
MMPIQVERKLFKVGEGGIAITLPKAWTNYHHLGPGDMVEIVADEQLIVRVKTQPPEKSI